MLNYLSLSASLQGLRPPLTEAVVVSQLAPVLVQAWLNDYGRVTPKCDVVETKDAGFSYLFRALINWRQGTCRFRRIGVAATQ
jgi:hypothetical protein